MRVPMSMWVWGVVQGLVVVGLHGVEHGIVQLVVDELVILFKEHPSLASPGGHVAGLADFSLDLEQFVEPVDVLDG